MERWHNRVAVVTGASRGIGENIAKELLKAGLIVVGLARREVRMYKNMKQLSDNLRCNFYPIKCDVTVESEVIKAFKWIDENLGGTDILVNSVGIIHFVDLVNANNTYLIKETINTNVMGVFYCIREAFASMKRRNVYGHIVIMSSACRIVPIVGTSFPSINIFPASKAAIHAMAETFRQEFAKQGNKTKVTTISPGAMNSDVVSEITDNMPTLRLENCTEAILYVLGTPIHVEVQDILLKPVGELF